MKIKNAAELIYRIRKYKGLSQEEVSNDICSTVTFSEIENEKIKIKQKFLKKILCKLGYCNLDCFTFSTWDDLDFARLISNVRIYLSVGNCKEAIRVLRECEKKDSFNEYQKAECIYLLGIVELILSRQNNVYKKCFRQCKELLELNKKNISEYTLLLEYEVIIMDQYGESGKTKIKVEELKEFINESVMSYDERIFLKMLLYGVAYNNTIEQEEEAKEYLFLCKKYEDRCGLHFFSIIKEDIGNSNRGVIFRTADLFYMYGNSIELELEEFEKLVKKIAEKSCDNEVHKVLEWKDILRYHVKLSNRTDEAIFYGVSDGKYNNYFYGKHRISLLTLQHIIERTGTLAEEYEFLGSSTECFYNELRRKVFSNAKIDVDQIQVIIKDLKDNFDVILFEQMKVLVEAKQMIDFEKKILMLEEALSLTVPNIDINNIERYSFSRLEMMILNYIGYLYIKQTKYDEAQLFLDRILKLYLSNIFDISFLKEVFSKTMMLYIFNSYKLKNYKLIIDFVESHKYDAFLYNSKISKEILRIYAKSCKKENIRVLSICIDFGEENEFTKLIDECFDEVLWND